MKKSSTADCYSISKKDRNLKGTVVLGGSKSISNRALIIRALCDAPFEIKNLSTSNDTQTLLDLLGKVENEKQGSGLSDANEIYDAGAAGTTFRFLTAFLSMQEGEQILTGTERMKQRPIGVLVKALRHLGADITYEEKEGYPPLRISSPSHFGQNAALSIPASTSSQYISALLMIAPTLSQGLSLTLEGNIVSRSYIEMTLKLMAYFGVQHQWEGNLIRIEPQVYQAKSFTVEADWSAASYYYSMAAFADEVGLQLDGLYSESVQGDSILAQIMFYFGVNTEYNENGIRLTKNGIGITPLLEHDFLLCPDIAQTLAVICAGLGVQGLFSGLDTLSIKETDRIQALKNELAKVNAFFYGLPPHFSKKSSKKFFMVEGKAVVKDQPRFATYEDHRMAMAFAPLAMLGPIKIEEPMVVAKSYPRFWDDLASLGFDLE